MNKNTRLIVKDKNVKRTTWRDTPKIIDTIPTDKETMIMYIDESGEGNKTMLKKAFIAKKNNEPYKQRNDLYLLNGVILSGAASLKLKKNMDKLKKCLSLDGAYDYPKKGRRPIVLHNSEINDNKGPFCNAPQEFYDGLENIIKSTNFKEISAGLNYYSYTQCNEENLATESSPLLMSLGILLINYAEYLNSINKKGMIIFEEETEKHDKLKLKYILKVLKYGNKTYPKDFFSNITAVYFRKKWTEEIEGDFTTTAGLELADITISPLRRIIHPEFLLQEKKLYNFPNYIGKGINIIR